ncbi:hypothetical protein Clacol_003881 [Clathrus columnatus]|uniref:Uncharacterized protein n=1 Tax=Clathrus columnatus TaxID=1419009 RepID=A0AAV5A818_9AGAM|nr:hypothetical protein Clacol_003881 [Clathrus columnatus]
MEGKVQEWIERKVLKEVPKKMVKMTGEDISSSSCYSAKILRRYYAASANAVPKQQVNTNSSSTSSSASSSSEDVETSDSKKVIPQRSRSRRTPSKRDAETQARKEEIRLKALATLDKSTKFIAAGLDHSKTDPTLADLDFFKPTTPPLFELDFIYPEATAFLRPRAPKDSALDKYGSMFERLVDTLTSKFSKLQLVTLYKQGIERPTPKGQGQPRPMKKLKTARDFAVEIVRWRWKWPYVKEIVDRKTAHEFFLLLGPNGSTFQELTDKYGVVLKQVEHTNTGFNLLVSGLCYSLDQLAIVLAKRREQIITETITSESFLGSVDVESIHEDSLRRISKHANALVEELPSGMFQISALDVSNINTAKRLVIRTCHQSMDKPVLFNTPELNKPHPRIPPSSAKFSISARKTHIRLIYRVITKITEKSRILKLDIKPNNDQSKDYATPLSPSSLLSSGAKTSTASLDLTADFRDMLTDENKGLSGNDYDYLIRDNLEAHKKEKKLLSSAVQVWDGTENIIDVALPTRPVDIRFSSLESLRIPLLDLPTEMQDYVGQLLPR